MSEFPAPAPPPRPGAPPFGAGASGPRASFFHRLAAFLIDFVLVNIVGAAIQLGIDEALGAAVSLAMAIAYFGFLEGSNSGQTIGKRMLGIRVIDFDTGGPIGFGRAVLRYLGRLVSALPCFLGFLWMLWDKEKQTWHDKFAADVVVPVSSYPVASWPN
jgi:uncharacterized RDD family membrane protein YckC